MHGACVREAACAGLKTVSSVFKQVLAVVVGGGGINTLDALPGSANGFDGPQARYLTAGTVAMRYTAPSH